MRPRGLPARFNSRVGLPIAPREGKCRRPVKFKKRRAATTVATTKSGPHRAIASSSTGLSRPCQTTQRQQLRRVLTGNREVEFCHRRRKTWRCDDHLRHAGFAHAGQRGFHRDWHKDFPVELCRLPSGARRDGVIPEAVQTDPVFADKLRTRICRPGGCWRHLSAALGHAPDGCGFPRFGSVS